MGDMKLAILSPLHRAVRQVMLSLEEAIIDAGLDVRPDEGHALSYIGTYGPCPTGNVQRVLGVKRSTVTSLLDRLVRRGLIIRQGDPSDGRVVLVQVTAAGRRLVERLDACALKLEQRIAEQIGTRDRAALHRILAAIDQVTGVTVVDHHSRQEP